MNVQELRAKLNARPTDYDFERTYNQISNHLNVPRTKELYTEFYYAMKPYVSSGRGEITVNRDSYQTLLQWLDKLDSPIVPLNLASSPHALPPAPIGNNALVELDEWLNSNPSKLSETTYDTLSSHVNCVNDWLIGLGQDFEEVSDEFNVFARSIARKRVTLEQALVDTRKRVDELGQIYLELRAPVSTSPKDAALAQGSTFEKMKAYVDYLVTKKTIDKAEAKILLELHNGASSAAVGRVRLRNELKKY